MGIESCVLRVCKDGPGPLREVDMRFPAFATIRSSARVWFATLLAGVGLAAVAAPAAQAARSASERSSRPTVQLGIKDAARKKQQSGRSHISHPRNPPSPRPKNRATPRRPATLRTGSPTSRSPPPGTLPNEAPSGVVTHVRTDVGPGVSINPEAVAQCTMKEFDANEKEEEAIPGTGFYPEPKCKKNKEGEVESEIGVNLVTVYAGSEGVAPGISDLPLEGIGLQPGPARRVWPRTSGSRSSCRTNSPKAYSRKRLRNTRFPKKTSKGKPKAKKKQKKRSPKNTSRKANTTPTP